MCILPFRRNITHWFVQYKSWNPDKAVEDYYTRIRDHEKYYETLDDKTWPFIKIINVCLTNFLLMNFSHTQTLGRREDHSKCTSLSKCLVQLLKFPI